MKETRKYDNEKDDEKHPSKNDIYFLEFTRFFSARQNADKKRIQTPNLRGTRRVAAAAYPAPVLRGPQVVDP